MYVIVCVYIIYYTMYMMHPPPYLVSLAAKHFSS